MRKKILNYILNIQDEYLTSKLIRLNKKNNDNLIEDLRVAQKKLNLYNYISNKRDEHLEKCGEYKEAYIDDLTYIYEFFITMIGVIDARIIEYKKEMIRFPENEKEINKKLNRCLKIRKSVVEEFFDYSNDKFLNAWIEEIIKEIPSFNKMHLIYDDMLKYNGNFDRNEEFIKAYDRGLADSLYYDFDNVLDEYRILYLDLDALPEIENKLKK